ncbi:cytochrome P450 4C1-like isoform X2 [Photinus pyralis]|nr:cytochrome P450 4C1-like isoform X2 [Photinus pyralis]XP_031342519.1 cytochrome P450 4C1-like isoform X2 [Photinus pyralis]
MFKFWHTIHAVVWLSHPDDVEVILSSMKHISKSRIYESLQPWLGTGLLTSTGTKWKERRQILTPALHFGILREFLNIFNDYSTLLVQKFEAASKEQPINIVPVITDFTLHTICETAMGTQLKTNEEQSKQYIDAIYRMGEVVIQRIACPWLQYAITFFLSGNYYRQEKLLKIMHTFSRKVIQDRKRTFSGINVNLKSKKRLALLDMLISAQLSRNDIDDDGIREEVDTFMFEGHDTTTSCISFTLLMIANHAEVQDKIVEELDAIFDNSDRLATVDDLQSMTYLEKVIKETLRICPSVPIISRSSEEDIELPSGYTIPKGTICFMHIFELHRNPEVFPNPEQFDPERFSNENSKHRHPFAYIPFSAGPRNCIGQRFAFLEVKVMVSSILRKFRLEPVDSFDKLPLVMHLILKSRDGIRIKFRKRDL